MIEIIILAVALSMDSFAVSIGLGVRKNTANFTLKTGIFFAMSQALMLFIGYLGGKSILGWVESYAYWVASGLLTIIGVKMIYESFQKGIEENILAITNKIILTLAIATSIDAMAAGFSLTLLDVSPYIACLITGMITFIFSVAGVFMGKNSGIWLKSKAEIFGGIVLILLGVKMLVF